MANQSVISTLLSALGMKKNDIKIKENDIKESKILIAYYSLSGNTKVIAKNIQKATGGDLFRIETTHQYPDDFNDLVAQIKEEIESGFRPKLITKVINFDKYETIFIGSPNWWGTITPAVSSFLDSYNFNGKKVIPFITHGKVGAQNTIKDMTAQCKGAFVLQDGWVGEGSSTEGFDAWIESINY